MSKKSSITATVREYAEASTVHGVSYVFSRSLSLSDRLLWTLVTLVCLGLSIYWSVSNFNDWQDRITITTLKVLCMNDL